MFMLCKPITENELSFDESNHIAQIKVDGERSFIIKENGNVTLLNRNQRNITPRFPQIVNAVKDMGEDFILDCEIAFFKGDKSFFNEGRQKDNWGKCRAVVFDIIKLNGQNLKDTRLRDRISLLLEHIQENEFIKIAETTNDIKGLWNKAKAEQLEGIVIKDLNGIYIGDKRNWFKLKIIKQKDIVFNGYEINNNNTLTCFNDNMRVLVASSVEAVKGLIDLYGKATLEINYMEETEKGKLRQPTFSKIVEVTE